MMESAPPERIAFLGGYLPRLCGIATFTHDLCEAVADAAPGSQCFAGAMNDQVDAYDYPPRVRFELDQKDLDSYRRAADFLNFSNADLLCIQHEFGIYGGPGGSHLMALLKEVRMPVVTTLHTILRDPQPAQRRVMEELIQRSDRLVVMARMGASILHSTYGVPENKVEIIPHGIPPMPFTDSLHYKEQLGVDGRMVLLTFGLLGPGKGIEYVIEALPKILSRHPNVVYLVLGATHPHLVARDGESYRLGLERLAKDRGVNDHVIFYNRFVSLDDLRDFIGATDIYITPYLNEAQITSGTLAYVFGAGKAVVSTPYWHAAELLADGKGALVPFRDPAAIATAVCKYLDDSNLMRITRERAFAIGIDMIWPTVALRYLSTFRQVCAERKAHPRSAFAEWTLASRPYDLPPLRLDHILRMTDGTGMFQHATFTVPNFDAGYCVDDNSRAFVLCILLDELGGRPPSENLERLATIYLAFLHAAVHRETGRFRNFMSHDRHWLEEVGSEDSQGRALWAVGTGAARSRNVGHGLLSAQLFEKGMKAALSFTSPRAWAFSLLGIHAYLCAFPNHSEALALREKLTENLIQRWHYCATETWPWFESSATYENARLCQALIMSGRTMPNPDALEIGLRSLQWLVSVQTSPGGHFRPIGSNGFYEKEGGHADYDQQPVEAQSMVSACLEAWRATKDTAWLLETHRAFEWFLGRNDLGLPLYDPGSGGCRDGLHPDRTNNNQGSESTLAFHLSRAELGYAEHPIFPALAGGA